MQDQGFINGNFFVEGPFRALDHIVGDGGIHRALDGRIKSVLRQVVHRQEVDQVAQAGCVRFVEQVGFQRGALGGVHRRGQFQARAYVKLVALDIDIWGPADHGCQRTGATADQIRIVRESGSTAGSGLVIQADEGADARVEIVFIAGRTNGKSAEGSRVAVVVMERKCRAARRA